MDLITLTQLLGNIGEFAGAVVVFVTLLFIYFQLKQNDKNARSATAQNIVAEANALNLQLGLNGDLADLFARVANDPDGQSQRDYQQGAHIIICYINVLLQAYWLRQEQRISDTVWQNAVAGLAPYARCAAGRKIVEAHRGTWDDGFLEVLEMEKPMTVWTFTGFKDTS